LHPFATRPPAQLEATRNPIPRPVQGADTPEGNRETWLLVHFIRHLPQITEDEIEQMNGLNPRSPRESAEEDEEMRFLEEKDTSAPTQEHHH